MDKSLLYVKEELYSSTEIYQTYQKECINIKSFVNRVLKEKFIEFAHYKKYVNKYLSISKNAPIYVDNQNILFYLNDSNNSNRYLINRNNIVNICYDGLVATIIFINGSTLEIKVKKETIKSNIKKCDILYNYFFNL